MLLIPFIPLIQIKVNQPVELYETFNYYQWLLLQTFYLSSESAPLKTGFTWAEIAVFIYISGILFFTLRYFYFLIRIGYLIRNGEKTKLRNGITLIIHEKDITPFSWMQYVLLSRKNTSIFL
jgi:hypothetical protein